MKKISELFVIYEEGGITETELCNLTVLAIANDNDTIEGIPEKMVESIKKFVYYYPKTERGWSRIRSFSLGHVVTEEEKLNFRHGVELVRDYYDHKNTDF